MSLLSEFYGDHAAVGDEVLKGGAEGGFADVDVGAGQDSSVGKDEDVLVVFLLEFVQEFRYAVVHFAEGFATGDGGVDEIVIPLLDVGVVNLIVHLHLPSAKVELFEAVIQAGRRVAAECSKFAGAGQGAAVDHIEPDVWNGSQRGGSLLREGGCYGDIGLAVTGTFRYVRGCMSDKIYFHRGQTTAVIKRNTSSVMRKSAPQQSPV